MMFLRAFPFAALVMLLLALPAGRWDLPMFWAYTAVLWLSAGTIFTLVQARSPELIKERLRPPADRDRATRRIALPVMIAHYVVAGLDAGRFGWTRVPFPLQVAGLVLLAAGMALVGWTLLSNPYASSAVRIQAERKQRVITTGPYAIVRHPMYLGVLFFGLGSGAALGSWFAAALLTPLVALFVRRTLFEDRMLHDELEGYAEYAARVRWRVVPGLF
jgi:protein-S-isoprenylcysteine O-methyltransferase Ste14